MSHQAGVIYESANTPDLRTFRLCRRRNHTQTAYSQAGPTRFHGMVFGWLVQRRCGEHTDARMETASASSTQMQKLLEAPHVVAIHSPPLAETRNALSYDVRGQKQSIPPNRLAIDERRL